MLSEKLAAFENAFDTLNRIYFENKLSKSVVTIYPTPGAYGHFSCAKVWERGSERYHEINLAAADIARPLTDVIATLVHEMVHQWCAEQNIKDTSRGNTYHNKRFKEEAEKRGLLIERHPTYGWALTKPSEGLATLVSGGAFAEVEAELHRRGGTGKSSGGSEEGDAAKPKKSWHRYVCPECGAWVRAQKEVHVKCGDCDKDMEEED